MLGAGATTLPASRGVETRLEVSGGKVEVQPEGRDAGCWVDPGEAVGTETKLDDLLELRATIQWDWPDGVGRDVALQAIDALLRDLVATEGVRLKRSGLEDG